MEREAKAPAYSDYTDGCSYHAHCLFQTPSMPWQEAPRTIPAIVAKENSATSTGTRDFDIRLIGQAALRVRMAMMHLVLGVRSRQRQVFKTIICPVVINVMHLLRSQK